MRWIQINLLQPLFQRCSKFTTCQRVLSVQIVWQKYVANQIVRLWTHKEPWQSLLKHDYN